MLRKQGKTIRAFPIWTAVLLGTAVVGCRHLTPPPAPAVSNAADEDEAYKEIHLLTKAIVQVRKDYVDDNKVSYHDLVHGALHGMLQSLDPHSEFMEPRAYENMRDETAGEYGGIGVVVGVRDGGLSVIAPMEDTPGFRAGLLAGDRIIEIDGGKTDDLTLQGAVDKLRGLRGTKVKLKVFRAGDKDLREFEMVREVIRLSSVKGVKMLEGNIGYVRITQFSEPTSAALHEAIQKLLKDGMKAFVLDLRNNPGGLLNSAITVSEQFLHRGDIIVSTRGRSGRLSQQPVRVTTGHDYPDFPMVVLVNGGSASASEIVSGALQDHKRAVLVGERTYGKASVQSVFQLDDGSALRLTTAKYYTPNERMIHEKGIEPDIVVPLTGEEWQKVVLKRSHQENPEFFSGPDKEGKEPSLENVTDRQLERAVDILKGIMIFEAKK